MRHAAEQRLTILHVVIERFPINVHRSGERLDREGFHVQNLGGLYHLPKIEPRSFATPPGILRMLHRKELTSRSSAHMCRNFATKTKLLALTCCATPCALQDLRYLGHIPAWEYGLMGCSHDTTSARRFARQKYRHP